jgi:hypothetical protein
MRGLLCSGPIAGAAQWFWRPRGASAPLAPQHRARAKAGSRGVIDARTGMPARVLAGAMCVQKFDDSLKICNSHYVSHFAAFFIDAGAKRSVVAGCNRFCLI